MSLIGTKPTSRHLRCLAAVGGKADIGPDLSVHVVVARRAAQ
jgi:hypothetical protein